MGMQIAGLGNVFLPMSRAGASTPTPPTPTAFKAMTPVDQIAYIASVSIDKPPFVVLGDPATPPQLLATVSPDGKSVATSDVPASYSAALAKGTSPSADDFQSWAGPLQLSYLRQAGGPTQSLTLFSGPNGFTAAVNAAGTGATVVQQIGGLGKFWSTATVATSAAAASAAAAATAAAAAAPPSAATFASWTPAAQAAYVAAQSGDTPAFAVVGDPTSDQSLVTTTANGSLFTTPVPSSYSKALASGTAPSLDDFRSWPDALQVSYLRAEGTGSPPSLTLTSTNTALPSIAGAVTATATLSGGSVTLTSTSATVSGVSDTAAVTGYLFGGAPISPDAFFALSADQQGAFVKQIMERAATYVNATSSNPAYNPQTVSQNVTDAVASKIDLGPSNTGNLTFDVPLALGQSTITLVLQASAYQGCTDPLKNGVSDASGFATWPPQVQAAYVSSVGQPSNGYPRSVVIGNPGNGVTATLLSEGDQVQTTPNDAGFLSAYEPASLSPPVQGAPAYTGTNNPIPLDQFLSWSSAEQQAFAAKVMGPNRAAGFVLTSSLGVVTLGPTSVDGTAKTAPTGWTYQIDTSTLRDPSSPSSTPLDVTAFQVVLTPAQQLAYLTKYGKGSPPVLKIQTTTGDTEVMSVTPGGGGVALEPLPVGYKTPPAALDPATFAGWSPAVRQSYTFDNGTGTPPAVVVGSSGPSQITASVTAAGALVMIVTPGALSTAGLADNLIPYANLTGGVTGLNSVNQTVAGILFPVLNGDPTVAGSTILPTDPQTAADKQLVADFNTPPTQLDANTFGAWNSAVQLQYLRANDPLNQGLAIGIPNSADGVLHAFMSAPTVPQLLPQKVYVVENIQKQDISTMALADQKKLAGLPAFQTVAQSLGLIPDGIDSSNTGGIHAANSAQASAIIQGQFTTAFNTIADPSTGVPSIPKTPGAMPDADEQVFKDELTLIQTQAAGSAIFSPKDIQDKINAVITRFQRAYAFGITANLNSYSFSLVNVERDETGYNPSNDLYVDAKDLSGYEDYYGIPTSNDFHRPVYDPVTKTYSPNPNFPNDTVTDLGNEQVRVAFGQKGDSTNVYGEHDGSNSTKSYTDIYAATFRMTQRFSNTDQNAGITSGYNVFMTQEKAILAQSNRAQSLASNTSGTQNLDVPNLVYLFQLYTNLTGEATLRADTEQVNQTNTELQTYAVMQRIINQTVAKIGSSTDGHALVGSADDGGDFTPEEQQALAIFGNGAGVPLQSPIELLQGIHRPTTNTASWNSQTGPSWSQFGTELSDTVTLLNQNSQLKMNDINAETKQKDRNFDLANSALSKMNDVLTKIASSIG